MKPDDGFPIGQELRFLEKVYMISYAQTHFLVVISRKVYHSQLPEPFGQISHLRTLL